MNEFEIESMDKLKSKVSVGVHGPSGSGKTIAMFKIAMGIRDLLYPGEELKDIAVYIDTEKRSSTKAVGRNVGGETLEPLGLIPFTPPYTMNRLFQLMSMLVEKGIKIVVIDSYSAFWNGENGILDRVAELETAGVKKAYGAWSEKEIVQSKNLIKNIVKNEHFHVIAGLRSKTDYVLEENFKGKLTPRAVGTTEQMQSDVRYEFDVFMGLDRDTHGASILKDQIGYEELRFAKFGEDVPITIADGVLLAEIASKGFTPEEVKVFKKESLIKFILDEKAHKSSKVEAFETQTKVILTPESLEPMDFEKIQKIVNYIK